MTRLAILAAAATLLLSPALKGQSPGTETPPKPSGADAPRRVYRPLPPPDQFSPPALSLPDPVHDWGTAYRGETIEHVFAVENTGGSPLSIEDVKPNCGCTVPKGADYKKVLQPGEKTMVTLSVDTSGLKGATKKYAEVVTNVQGDENKLWMQGTVEELLVVKPPQVQVQVIRKGTGTAGPTVVELAANLQKTVKIASIKPVKNLVAASLKEIEPGKRFEVTLTPTLKDERSAFLSETLETSVEVDGRAIALRLPVSVTVRDRIEVIPAKSVYFTRKDTGSLAASGAAPLTKELQVQSIGGPGHAFQILKAESKDKLFTTSVAPIEPGKRYKLVITLEKAPEKAQRFVRDTIQVSTDDPELPVITIPAMAQF
jgi:hypothetical protein